MSLYCWTSDIDIHHNTNTYYLITLILEKMKWLKIQQLMTVTFLIQIDNLYYVQYSCLSFDRNMILF